MPKGTKVLLVDDDKMLIELYKERLELAGYQVEISRDGEEGLAKIHQVKPDLVLLDIMMPKVNGYEALASIKSDPATKDTPVIILSALMRDINKSKAIESGADDYIIKSEAMPADVIKKIEAVLKKYKKDIPVATTPNMPTPPVAPLPGPPASPNPLRREASRGEPPAPPVPPEPPAVQAVPPPAPPAPPAPSPQEIQFEPQAAPQPAVPPAIATVPGAVESKPSPMVIFFLILIVILILASDLFFYMKYITSR